MACQSIRDYLSDPKAERLWEVSWIAVAKFQGLTVLWQQSSSDRLRHKRGEVIAPVEPMAI